MGVLQTFYCPYLIVNLLASNDNKQSTLNECKYQNTNPKAYCNTCTWGTYNFNNFYLSNERYWISDSLKDLWNYDCQMDELMKELR
jgi:hypothetical protein